MSLICTECKKYMGPTQKLPGRDGMMVRANTISLVWDPKETKKFYPVYLLTMEGVSLCFNCIENKAKANLQIVYECIESEEKYRRIEESERGKWLSSQGKGSNEAFQNFEDKYSLINQEICYFCGQKLPLFPEPFFTAIAINRFYSSQHLTFLNYSWTSIKTGMTRFNFCLNCCQKNFPNIFRILSFFLRKVRDPKEKFQSELAITRDFLDALEKQISEAEAHKKISVLKQQFDRNIKII